MRISVRKISRWFLFIVLVAGCIYVLRPGFVTYLEHHREIRRLEAEIIELEAEREELTRRMRALQNENPECIERLAREKLHLIRPGETIFRFKKAK